MLQEASADESGSEEQNQPELQDEGNKDAARALLRVKQKLDGYEGGEMRSLQGQVYTTSWRNSSNFANAGLRFYNLLSFFVLSGTATDSRCTGSRAIEYHVSRVGCLALTSVTIGELLQH